MTLLPERHSLVYADAGDDGFRFIMPSPPGEPENTGGLNRDLGHGHLVTIVGRGGTGKSLLALQLTTHLLAAADVMWPPADRAQSDSLADRPHSAFYFTLEATTLELSNQARQFTWGKTREYEAPEPNRLRYSSKGLQIFSVPSPVASLTALNLLIRQYIARELPQIGRIVAIVIDPLGGITFGDDPRAELSQLRELAISHGTFLFLLTEDYVFEKAPSIEHFSQSIIHLEHDPRSQPPRRLYVQKARRQSFQSGYHQFELHPTHGIRVFPSLQAQSAYAHDLLAARQGLGEDMSRQAKREPLLRGLKDSIAAEKKAGETGPFEVTLEPGSVVFLMGPPGTFKQHIATLFAEAAGGATLYISFKADISALGRSPQVTPLSSYRSESAAGGVRTLFLDARSPILTPEEILFDIRRAIIEHPPVGGKRASIGRGAAEGVAFRRAVVWGLRRLSDQPNFAGEKAVQFLEALVTLLRSQEITSLLVDWPDPEKPSTLPIVDLSQYILLTRVCLSRDATDALIRDQSLDPEMLAFLWQSGREHVALLRVQRTPGGLHRNLGAVFFRQEGRVGTEMIDRREFERYWLRAGIRWEQDPGLAH